jgi:hypothetical protein
MKDGEYCAPLNKKEIGKSVMVCVVAFVVAVGAGVVGAAPTLMLPAIFKDGMVLQHTHPIVFGYAIVSDIITANAREE